MKAQKNADDLNEIMGEQLDVLTGATVSDDDIKKAAEIANMIGKSLKLASLRLAYQEYQKQGGKIIETLEARK